jgi:hypothetical protein
MRVTRLLLGIWFPSTLLPIRAPIWFPSITDGAQNAHHDLVVDRVRVFVD